MRTPSLVSARRLLVVSTLLALGMGCALRKANQAYDQGRYDDAVAAYRQVILHDPNNVKARIGIQRASELASEQHMTRARRAEQQGRDALVEEEVRKALVLNPDNQIAQDWLIRIRAKAEKARTEADAANNLEEIKARADAENPLQLNPRSMDGIDLNFSRRTSLKSIFETLSRATGVNILFHNSFQDSNVSIDLRGLTFQRVLDALMLQNDLFYKVIDKNTIMVFKSTPQNRELYENQILKTYYLSNAEPDQIRPILTTLDPQLRVFTDKRINAIIVKARPTELAIVDHVIQSLDKPKAEVMVYLELMEVTENSLEQVGLLPVINATDTSGVYRIGATTVNNTTGMNTNSGLTNIKRADIRVLFPNLALDFLKSNGDARLVASPNIRVLSGESGEINIGEKVSTTQSQLSLPTSGTTGTAGAASSMASSLLGGVGQTSFAYEDVGVKIKVEPRVNNDGDITLKIDCKVTTLKSGSTPGRPDLGNREIKTSARLRDGETAIFGGLLKDEEQKSLQGIWGLSDIPFLGRLFGNTNDNKAKTDVILTIRTVLVRRPVLTEQDLAPFNPDDATTRTGPFAPKPAKTQPAATEATPEPVTPPAPAPVPVKQGTPAAPATAPAALPSAPATPPAVAAPAVPTPASAEPKAPAVPPVAVAPTPQAPAASDLVFFMTPVAAEIHPKEHVQVSLIVSGGKGLASGSLDLSIPPGLRVASVAPGDFITTDGGSFQQIPGKDGALRIVFKRNPGSVDSGLFATLDLEGVAPGNAPVLIQGGQFLEGTTPISGRWSNALVTVK
jgi:general secretion pathway protein D